MNDKLKLAKQYVIEQYGDLIEKDEKQIEKAFMDGTECVRLSLPHDDVIDSVIDKLLIIRGEHPDRVRNPIYGEERQLVKDVVKYIILSN